MSSTARLGIRHQLDAEQLVWTLLHNDYPSLMFPHVSIQSEIGINTSALSSTGEVVVYSVGSPWQTGRVKAWMWQFPLTLSVFGPDADTTFDLASDLYEKVVGWEFKPATAFGSVGKVDAKGFHRVAGSKEMGGKTVKSYVGEFQLTAADPF